MNTITIKINDFVSCHKGITPDEGEPIYNRIKQAFAEGSSVCLDFTNIEMMTTAFLNVVIGNLYKDYSSEQLKELLSFSALSDSTAIRIKRVTDNAKLFYKDEHSFNRIINDIINGN